MGHRPKPKALIRAFYALLVVLPILFVALFQVAPDEDFLFTEINPAYTVVACMAFVSIVCGYPLLMARIDRNMKNTLGFSVLIAAFCLLLNTPILYHYRVSFTLYLFLSAGTAFGCIISYMPMAGNVSVTSIVISTIIYALPQIWIEMVMLSKGMSSSEIHDGRTQRYLIDSKYYDPGNLLWTHLYGSLFGLMSEIISRCFSNKEESHGDSDTKSSMDEQYNYFAKSSSLFGLLIIWSLYPSFSTYQSDTIPPTAGSENVGSLMFNLSTHILYTSQCASALVSFPLNAILDNGKFDVAKIGAATMAGAYAAAPMVLPLKQYTQAEVINDYIPHPVATVFCAMLSVVISSIVMKFCGKKTAPFFGPGKIIPSHTIPAIVGFIFRVIYVATVENTEWAKGYASIFGLTILLGLGLGSITGVIVYFVERTRVNRVSGDAANWGGVKDE